MSGEHIRSNLTEGQPGVPLYVDLEFIDISTCEPLSGVFVDIWSGKRTLVYTEFRALITCVPANATGVYAGVVAEGNGVGTSDASNIVSLFSQLS